MGTPLQELSAAFSSLAAKTAASVVSVHSKGSHSAGFVWKTGLIVTADDALAEEGEVGRDGPGGEAASATIVGRDPTTDIALLRVAGINISARDIVGTVPALGSLAMTVGAERRRCDSRARHCLALRPGLALTARRRDRRPPRARRRLRRASEGAVAIDASGQVFGMAVFGPRRRVVVIPAATIARVAARLETHGRIPRGYLGLEPQTGGSRAAAGPAPW